MFGWLVYYYAMHRHNARLKLFFVLCNDVQFRNILYAVRNPNSFL